jgi:hypothetical protein
MAIGNAHLLHGRQRGSVATAWEEPQLIYRACMDRYTPNVRMHGVNGLARVGYAFGFGSSSHHRLLLA